MLGARLALKFGLAVNTAGGTHHAFPGTSEVDLVAAMAAATGRLT